MKNKAVFIVTYCVAMAFTYLWRWAMFGAVLDGNNDDDLVVGTMFILLLNYIVLIIIAYLRAKNSDKGYLIVFPIIAGFFDILLGFIPLVPSVMNIVTVILGMQIRDQSGVQCPVCKEWIQENASVCRFCKTNLINYYHIH